MWASTWRKTAVLLCALATSQGEEWKLVWTESIERSVLSNDTGTTEWNFTETHTVYSFSRPTVDGVHEKTDSFSGMKRRIISATPGIVEINSTADIVVRIESAVWSDYLQLVPATQTIYGQCAEMCTIAIWGRDTSIPIERSCTDGSTVLVQAGTFFGSPDYNGPSCRWSAPAGYKISGFNNRNFTAVGRVDSLSSFLPAEYFQLTTPVPLVFPLLMLISAGPARCLYGSSSSVILAGAAGVYHARLTAVNAATIFQCDTPVTAMGEAECPAGWPQCGRKEVNLIVAPVTTTTTLSSSTASTTTTTSSLTSTTRTSTTTASTTSSTTASTTTTPTTTATTTTGTTATTATASTTTTSTTTTATTTTSATTTTATTSTTTSATSTTTVTATTSTTTTTATTSTATSTTTTTTTNTPTSTSTTTPTITITTTATTSTTTTTTTGSNTTTITSATLSATTVTTTNILTPTGLVDRVEALEPALLTTLFADNVTTVTQYVGGLTLVAVRLDAAAIVAAGGALTVRLEASETAVTVPASVFANLGLGSEGVVLMLATADLTIDRLTANGSESEAMAVAAINVNLLSSTGRRLSVSGLEDPIELVMPVNHSAGVQCVFWDEGTASWATKGVERSVLGEGTLKCKSTHLTLFAAIVRGFVKTLACSQVSLLNMESIAELGKGDWQWTLGPMLYGVVLVTLALLLSLAACVDLRRWMHGRSSDKHLLIPLQAVQQEGTGDQANEEHRGLCASAVCSVFACCMYLLGCCLSSGALRDALDEIFSQWISYFGEVRDLLEGLIGGLELGMPTPGRIAALVNSLLSRTLVLSARRQVAASLGVSWDISALVMEEAELTDVVKAYRMRRFPDNGDPSSHGLQRGASTATLAREEAWGQLHSDLEVKLDVVMQASARWSSLPGTVWSLFLHQNPISTCLVHCALTSCKLRVLLFTVEVIGSFMLTTVFFSATGTPTKRARGLECGTDDSTFEFVGRVLAVGTGSILVSGIPAIILGSLCTRGPKKVDYEGSPQWKKQLTTWGIQDQVIWILGSLYVAFCTFFICVFLANTAPKDHGEWLLSSLISIMEGILLIPLATAVLLPLLVTTCLCIMSFHRRVTKEQLVSELHLQFKSDMNMAVVVGNI